MIEYIGQVKEPRPPNWPAFVRQDVIVEVEGMPGLKVATETHLIHIMRVNQGMVCRKDPDAPLNAVYVPDEQFFVPLHMIQSISTRTRRIVGTMPDEKGSYIKQ
jgi:hypothetical protein